MRHREHTRSLSPRLQALWNMRWPTLFLCGPVLGVVLVDLWFGLPGRLWPVAAGFFIFSLLLFAVLIRGEARRVRAAAGRR